jgi:membrane protease subunit HflK
MTPRQFTAVCLLALAAWLASGVFVVQPDELALIRRFGRLLPDVREPGLHFGLPWGLDRIERVKPREVRRVLIGGVALAGDSAGAEVPQLLTGDRNLVNVRATVQYVLADAASYVRNRHLVDRLAGLAGEAGLGQVMAARAVDPLLTQGKAEAAEAVRGELQALVDRYQLGIAIRSVDLGSIEPPPEVAESFAAVVSAQRERDQAVNRAHSYADQTAAQAKADAQKQVDQALSESEQVVRLAQGNADRFGKLYAEYGRAPQLTAWRLYQEMLVDVLPRLRAKLIIDKGQPIDLTLFATDPPGNETRANEPGQANEPRQP